MTSHNKQHGGPRVGRVILKISNGCLSIEQCTLLRQHGRNNHQSRALDNSGQQAGGEI